MVKESLPEKVTVELRLAGKWRKPQHCREVGKVRLEALRQIVVKE